MAAASFFIDSKKPDNKWLEIRVNNGKVWIHTESGEGMETNEKVLYECMRKFYNETF